MDLLKTVVKEAPKILRRPLYVSTPIFYVNATPHLGHLYSMLLADTRIRWERLSGHETFFTTGTDEHGLKIQAAAEKEGTEPYKFVTRVSKNFKQLAFKYAIHYDKFMRTTHTDHGKAVKHLWTTMVERDLIYKGSHSGWYSVSDEAFYPETQIMEVTDAAGNSKKVSRETGSEVVYQEEENYFFKLSQFQDQLLEYYEKNPHFVRPISKRKEIMNELRETKLTDLSVSRPTTRLKWGIRVPDDRDQRVYVWFDALVNYLTAVGYPESLENTPWPPTHVIGKDISRFHCIYWPIFLMAAGIPLPQQVIVHSHWLCDGIKMSKSLGNVVDPVEIGKYYGVDPVRFYLMEQSTLNTDANFSEGSLHFHRSTLINKFINIQGRVGSPAFDIKDGVWLNNKSRFDNIDELILRDTVTSKDKEELVRLRKDLLESLNALHGRMDGYMVQFDQKNALKAWWEVIEKANSWFQATQPWVYKSAIAKADTDELDKERILVRSYIVYLTGEALRIGTVLVQPFMPALSWEILDLLGVDKKRRTAEYAAVGADTDYGKWANDPRRAHILEKVKIRHQIVPPPPPKLKKYYAKINST